MASRGKILYFLATDKPTVGEAAAIAALEAAGYSVGVRNGSVTTTYGARLETCDGVAGTIPSAYSAKTSFDHSAEGTFALAILPASGAITGTGTKQLQVLKIAADGTVTDVTASCTYASGTPATATVNASSGLVTGVAAGTSVITATYTYATAKTMTATKTITVS
jgi:hypothetical protein